jgi:hypothetical protein
MARKQTLKSLLGGSDSRVEVDLNLDEQVFQAPTVRAGNYSVAAPVYAKTNALSQLSDALQQYSGPILRNYANIKEQQSIAMADAAELLTDEQLQQLNRGDLSGLKDSINETEGKFDDAQRKKLISFAENPNNYSRAYKRVGQRVAGLFTEDFMANMEKYAEDENFNFQNKADELAEQYNLQGLGAETFYKELNDIHQSTKAKFGQLKNEVMERNDAADIVNVSSLQIKNQTFNAEKLSESLAGKTLEQQENIYSQIIKQAVEESPQQAERLLEDYREGNFGLGNGAVRPEFVDELENVIANEETRIQQIANIEETKRNESVESFLNGYSNAFTLKTDIPASTDLFINDGMTISVDTSEAKTMADVAQSVAAAVAEIPENDRTVSQTVRNNLVAKFAGYVEAEKTKVLDFRTAAGTGSVASSLSRLYSINDSQNNNIYDLSDPNQITNKVMEDMSEINQIVDEIFTNPDLDTVQKNEQAKAAVAKFVAEKSMTHDQFVKDKEDSILRLEQEKVSGGDQQRFLLQDLYGLKSEDVSAVELAESRQEDINTIRRFDEETDRMRNEIFDREMTDEEIASGMTSEQFYQAKIKEAKKLNEDRRALFQADYAADDKIDGRTSEEQQPESVLSGQKDKSADTEVANVTLGNTAGMVDPSQRKKHKSKLELAAMKRNRFLNDLNSSKDSWGRVNRSEVTKHEYNLDSVLKWQSGEFDNRFNFKSQQEVPISEKQKEKLDERFTQQAADYLYGETLKRAAETGDTPITINELELGTINGVRFNPTGIDQSSHVILPYELVNKSFTDPDNLTVQEEAMLRDYASSLYDTSSMDDAGMDEIVQAMVTYQVNAYSLIGFAFSKNR